MTDDTWAAAFSALQERCLTELSEPDGEGLDSIANALLEAVGAFLKLSAEQEERQRAQSAITASSGSKGKDKGKKKGKKAKKEADAAEL